jgi:hypothetical protein
MSPASAFAAVCVASAAASAAAAAASAILENCSAAGFIGPAPGGLEAAELACHFRIERVGASLLPLLLLTSSTTVLFRCRRGTRGVALSLGASKQPLPAYRAGAYHAAAASTSVGRYGDIGAHTGLIAQMSPVSDVACFSSCVYGCFVLVLIIPML